MATAAAKIMAPAQAALAIKKKQALLFQAPEDWKNSGFEIVVNIDKDGLLAPGTSVVRILGRWDNENAKRTDWLAADPQTSLSFVARFVASVFATSLGKRIPPGQYTIVYAASTSEKDASMVDATRILKVACRKISITRIVKGKSLVKTIDKDFLDAIAAKQGVDSNPYVTFLRVYRRIRAGAKLCAGGLIQCAAYPSGRAIKVAD